MIRRFPLLLELHSHSKVVDITRWTKRVQWSEGVSAPWDSMSVDLALPLREIALRQGRTTGAMIIDGERIDDSADPAGKIDVSPGLWLKLSEYDTGRPLSICRVDSRPLNIGARPRGGIASRLSLQALGAFSFMQTLTSETIATIAEDIGGLMSISGPAQKRYFALYKRLVQRPRASELVGPDGLIALLAPVEIPPTLIPGVNTLGDMFRVAWGPDDAGKAAPLRVMSRVPLADTAALAHIFPSGGPLDVMTSIFQREPRLVEFFPSLEAPTNDRLQAGYADARPTIIHRVCPWITGPLSKMVTDPSGGPSRLSIASQWDTPTWNIERAIQLTEREGFSFDPNRAETNRVNVVTVDWSVAGGSPTRWLVPAGLPIVDQDDVRKHGARSLELNWDLSIGRSRPARRVAADGRIDPSEEGPWRTLRTVGLLGWHFYGLGHVFERGTINGKYLGLRARAGEPLSFDYGGKRPYTAYAQRVTHVAEARDRGVIGARTSIQFDRGLWDESLRDPHVYLESKPTAVSVKKPAKAEEAPPATDVESTDRKITAWIGAPELNSQAATIAQILSYKLDGVDLFINNQPTFSGDVLKPFRPYAPNKVKSLCASMTEAGISFGVSSWVSPEKTWMKGLESVAKTASEVGASYITLDAEGPWTSLLSSRPTSEVVETSARVFGAIREHFSGDILVTHIVGIEPRLIQPLIDACGGGSVPQAYDQEKNNHLYPTPGSLQRRAREKFKASEMVMGLWCESTGAFGITSPSEVMKQSLAVLSGLGVRQVRIWRQATLTSSILKSLHDWRSSS